MTRRAISKRRVLVEVSFAAGAIALIAVMLTPSISNHHAMRVNLSGSTARSLAMAAMQYEVEHRTPLDPETWIATLIDRDLIGPYDARATKSSRVPGDQYFYVPSGTLDARTNAITDILIYEHPRLFKDGGNVVRRSGPPNAEFLPADEFDDAINALVNPDGTPFAPHKQAP